MLQVNLKGGSTHFRYLDMWLLLSGKINNSNSNPKTKTENQDSSSLKSGASFIHILLRFSPELHIWVLILSFEFQSFGFNLCTLVKLNAVICVLILKKGSVLVLIQMSGFLKFNFLSSTKPLKSELWLNNIYLASGTALIILCVPWTVA